MASAPQQNKKLTLFDIIEDEDLMQMLMDFLKEELIQENFYFWLDVEGYKRVPESLLKDYYNQICIKYFSLNTELEVYVCSQWKDQIEGQRDNPSRDVFDLVQHEIFNTLSQRLPRFTHTERYIDYLINTPETKSRVKLESFFGMEIVGPLQRVELVSAKQRRKANAASQQPARPFAAASCTKIPLSPRHSRLSHYRERENPLPGSGSPSSGVSSPPFTKVPSMSLPLQSPPLSPPNALPPPTTTTSPTTLSPQSPPIAQSPRDPFISPPSGPLSSPPCFRSPQSPSSPSSPPDPALSPLQAESPLNIHFF